MIGFSTSSKSARNTSRWSSRAATCLFGRRDRNGRDKQLRRSLRDLHYDKSRRPHRNIRRSTGSEHVQQFTPQDIPTHVPPSDSLRHENTAVNDHPPRENATTNDREDAAVRESQRHNDATTNHLRQRHVAFGEAHTTTIQAHYPDPVIRQPHRSFGTLRRHTTRCIDDPGEAAGAFSSLL
jgi:hypothetical protein